MSYEFACFFVCGAFEFHVDSFTFVESLFITLIYVHKWILFNMC